MLLCDGNEKNKIKHEKNAIEGGCFTTKQQANQSDAVDLRSHGSITVLEDVTTHIHDVFFSWEVFEDSTEIPATADGKRGGGRGRAVKFFFF